MWQRCAADLVKVSWMKIPHSVMHVHTTVSRLCQSTAAPANINSHGLPDTEQSFQEKKRQRDRKKEKRYGKGYIISRALHTDRHKSCFQLGSNQHYNPLWINFFRYQKVSTNAAISGQSKGPSNSIVCIQP